MNPSEITSFILGVADLIRDTFPTAPLLLAVVGLLIVASAVEAQADAAPLYGPEACWGVGQG